MAMDMTGGRTWVPNYVFAHLLTLPSSYLKVLLFIIRRTLGWHKTEDYISISQIQRGVGDEEGTGLARSTVISAIQGLKDLGLIVVFRITSAAGDAAPSLIRLGPVLTTVVAPSGQGVARKSDPQKKNFQNIFKQHHDPSCPSELQPSPDDDASLRIETTGTGSEAESTLSEADGIESLNQTVQCLQALPEQFEPEASVEPHAPAPPEPLETSATVPHDVAPLSTPRPRTTEPTLPAAHSSTVNRSDGLEPLLERLMGAPLGYSRRSADQIVAQFPVDQIEAGLDNLHYRKDVRNPAGFLLRELQAGGYPAPPVRPGVRRAVLYVLPTPNDSPGAASGDNTGDESERRLQEAITALDADTRMTLWREARQNYARLAGKPLDKVSEDSVFVISIFENLVKERFLAA